MTERENLDNDPDNLRILVTIQSLMKSIAQTARGPDCPECKEAIDIGDRYCRHCGQKLKWEDENNGT